jgi:hypothetical protein
MIVFQIALNYTSDKELVVGHKAGREGFTAEHTEMTGEGSCLQCFMRTSPGERAEPNKRDLYT